MDVYSMSVEFVKIGKAYRKRCVYISTQFLMGMVINPTTFPLYPSTAHMWVTPNITSFSFWSI